MYFGSFDTMREAYYDICHGVIALGGRVEPRGMLTAEVTPGSFKLTNPQHSLPAGVGRKLNPNIGYLEAVQLIGGFSDPKLVERVAPNMMQFTDTFANGDPYFYGAYGPRVGPQVPEVISLLKRDPDTRQAVITVFNEDAGRNYRDIPCTVALQFLIRRGGLDLHVYMRSNDVWWGLAYDVFQFTQLQITMATVLDIEVGDYYHTATSMHAYERDWRGIMDLTLEEDASGTLGLAPLGLARPGDTWEQVQSRARILPQAKYWSDQPFIRYWKALHS